METGVTLLANSFIESLSLRRLIVLIICREMSPPHYSMYSNSVESSCTLVLGKLIPQRSQCHKLALCSF